MSWYEYHSLMGKIKQDENNIIHKAVTLYIR